MSASSSPDPDIWGDTCLSPEALRVLRDHGTERPGTSPLNKEKREGLYHCAACKNSLFGSNTKYESGSGWPSFFQPVSAEAVKESIDTSFNSVRTEISCAQCGGHLGHVFPDGPLPTGLRYCMNGVALEFIPKE